MRWKRSIHKHSGPLGSPNVVLGSAGFGSITSAEIREIQLGVKFEFESASFLEAVS